MSEVEKLYENVGIKLGCCKYAEYGYEGEEGTWYYCKKEGKECWTYPNGNANCVEKGYPPFTAEKQIEIENVILQNKKNYNKWIEYNINVYGEWVIRFVRTDKFAPYIALGKTRAEAFANVINHFWQSLTSAEKQQVKGILV